MYYDRVISPELEAIFKNEFKWLYDLVKKREDLDFLIGANKDNEWISVYRGLSRIVRIIKSRKSNSKIKIDADKAYVTLSESLKLYIYTDDIDKLSNIEGHLKTLLDHVSHDNKYERYYNNKKEGFYQNILSRKYGINSLPESDFVIIDKEVVIGYLDQTEKDAILGERQEKYRDLLKTISMADRKKFGKDLEKKAIGNELDFLAWKSDGTLLLIELKHGTNTSGIYLSPLQIGLYSELFVRYKNKNEDDFCNKLKKMVEQKQRMGLIHKKWEIPAKITSIKPMLLISKYNSDSTGMEKLSNVLAICREKFPGHLQNIEVRSFSCQQGELEMIFPDLEVARKLFKKAGFVLPVIPDQLAVRVKQRSELDFSTREIPVSPNYLTKYVVEVNENQVDDYVILSRAVNSPSRSAIHYFIVLGNLRMFLQLFWGGGAYIKNNDITAQLREIRKCFLLADQIVAATPACKASERLTIVCTNDGGSYWMAPDQSSQKEKRYLDRPSEVLGEALQWLRRNVEK